MKKQIKTLEKIQLSNEEIANLSDAEFKTQDTHRIGRVWSQNRGRNEVYAK